MNPMLVVDGVNGGERVTVHFVDLKLGFKCMFFLLVAPFGKFNIIGLHEERKILEHEKNISYGLYPNKSIFFISLYIFNSS